MTIGTSTFMSRAPCLTGENTFFQVTAATDIMTLTGTTSQTGDFFVCRDVDGTEGFAINLPPASTSASNQVTITCNDASTGSSGYARGLYINATASGTKTVSGEHNSLGVDLTVTGDTPYAYVQSLYVATSGDPTIGLVAAISVYMDDIGTGVSSSHMLDLQTGNPTASAAATRETYIRFRNHGTGTPTSIFYLQANNNAKAATNFIESDGNTVGPVAPSTTAITSGTNTTYRVRCLYGSTTFYLLGVAAG